MTTSPSSRRDLYEEVTQQIVTAIEAGSGGFELPWHHIPGLPKNLASDRPYRGINTLLLWLIGNTRGYATPFWATFKQWRELGHPVRKGETSATVVFWKQLGSASGEEAASSEEDRPRFVARAYHVFNAAQVDGFQLPLLPTLSDAERIAVAETFFAGLPITVHHDQDCAFYRPSSDSVHLPAFSRFRNAQAYYATRGHESVHATGHKDRLDRDLSGRFGSNAYAMEELVAELGAAFLCADLGMSPEPRPDHAAYLASWLDVLKSDSRAIFTAAGKAQAAVDWLHASGGG